MSHLVEWHGHRRLDVRPLNAASNGRWRRRRAGRKGR